ncbi:unnamed protein product, partial [Adineta steineri]
SEIIFSDNQIADTQPYELEDEQIVTDVIETKREEIHKIVINGDAMIDQVTTKTTTTTTTVIENGNPSTETLAYELQPTLEEITTSTTKTTTTVIENDNPPMETLAYDLPSTNDEIDLDTAAPALCTDTQEYSLDD